MAAIRRARSTDIDVASPARAFVSALAQRTDQLAHLLQCSGHAADGTDAALAELRVAYSTALPEALPAEFPEQLAQAAVCGLTALACLHTAAGHTQPPRRGDLWRWVPQTSPLLGPFWRFVLATEPDCPLRAVLDDLTAELEPAALHTAFHDQLPGGLSRFYEPYLAACNAAQRRRRGVYETPVALARFMVRAVDETLAAELGAPHGLLDLVAHGQKILDPATGSGVFLCEVVRRVHQAARRAWDGASHTAWQARWRTFARQHLLGALCGYERQLAAYVLCHVQVSVALRRTGVRLHGRQRLPVCLAGALAEARHRSDLAGDPRAEEARRGETLRRDPAIAVVLGNPPYARISSGETPLTRRLLKPYRAAVRGEANLQPLADDYVKFLALAQWHTRHAPRAVVCLVTNHNWLSGVLFRGLRESWQRHWPRIRLLDLHGDRGETRRGDENLFGIAKGVAVCLARRGGNGPGRVEYAEVYGTAAHKRAMLAQSGVNDFSWTTLRPRAPFRFFVPHRAGGHGEYDRWPALDELFEEYSSGLMTVRDRLAVARSRDELQQRFARFRDGAVADGEFVARYGVKDYRQWRLAAARRAVAADRNWKARLQPVLYRPFDQRWLYYSADVVSYPNWRVMRHLLDGRNLALVASRLIKHEAPAHVFVTRRPAEIICLSPKSSNNAFVFPLWRHEGDRWVDNLAPRLAGEDPLSWFFRTYALLHSATYRRRYAADLQCGFPRVPPPGPPQLEMRLQALGQVLVEAHLHTGTLRTGCRWHSGSDEDGDGGGVVAPSGPRYDAADQRLWINRHDFFAPLRPEVWEYRVGGYAVCRSWFSAGRRTGTSRLGTVLNRADRRAFLRIVAAVEVSLACQTAIDQTIQEAGGWPAAWLR